MTSLQDLGRVGQARFGISRSGAMDRLALAEANALVGNPPGMAAIELLLFGGEFGIEGGSARIAVAGAAMAVSINGEPVRPATSATIREGDTVRIGAAPAGVFAYLAVSGGFAVALALGSLSLQPRAGIGGLDGRPLRAGDHVPLERDEAPVGAEAELAPTRLDPEAPVRVVLGPQDDHFPPESIAAFLSTTYEVSAEADRMGYRLQGPKIAHLKGFNIVSDGLVAGSVQVPGSGVPIVMMADHQTTGGYPKIATVISADLRILAQRRQGAAVRFEAVGIAEAQAIACARAEEVADLPARLRPAAAGLPGVEALLGLNLAGDATDAFV